MHNHGNVMYQPIPFAGYEGKEFVRKDCQERWDAIDRNHDFWNQTVLDYGCAEGYMGFMAIKAGAKYCTFIDTDNDCLKTIADVSFKHCFSDKVYTANSMVGGGFDVCICLDLLYHPEDLTLRDLSDTCYVLFVSPAGDGSTRNTRLERDAKDIYENIIPIHTGYEGRTIYKCWQKKNQ